MREEAERNKAEEADGEPSWEAEGRGDVSLPPDAI